jgi:hydrogenase maturation protease
MKPKMKILVLGLGQSMRGDDSAGLEAVRIWQENHPRSASNVEVEFLDPPGLTLLEFMKGKEIVILVDAVHSPTASGEVLHLDLDDLACFNPETGSVHGWGVAETLRLGRLLFPELESCRLTLIGITGKYFGMGKGPSPDIRVAINEAAELVEKEIQKFLTNE